MGSSGARKKLLLVSVIALELAASPAFAQKEVFDPFERVNRKFYAASQVIDRAIFRPIAGLFGKTPGVLRRVIHNVTTNLSEPVVFVNDMLQGHVVTAPVTLGRFVINSTLGVAGMADVAGRTGIPHHDNGFGTTLGRWGVRPGPYIFLPVLGPSNARDTVGTLGDFLLNPLNWVHYNGEVAVGVGVGVMSGLQARYEAQPRLESIRATSTDPYATLRSFYSQNREGEIRGQTEPAELPEFDIPTDESAPAGELPPSETPSVEEPTGEAPSNGAPIAQPQAPGAVPPLGGESRALPRPVEPPSTAQPPAAEPSAPEPSKPAPEAPAPQPEPAQH
jgi:phospholipid-binding lipoprotein MlaA